MIAPLSAITDTTASSCYYVASPRGGTAACEAGQVTFTVWVPREDRYQIMTRVKAPDGNHNSYWVFVDNLGPFKWNPPPLGDPSAGLCDADGWCWDAVSDADQGLDPLSLRLSQGSHTIRFCAREPDTHFDLIELTTAHDFDTMIIPCAPTPVAPGGIVDTYLNQYDQTRNYGTDYALRVRVDNAHVSLLRVDLSHIPSDAVVTRARLKLYVTGAGGHPMTLLAHAVKRTWDANQATWIKATALTDWAEPGCRSTTQDYEATPAASTSLTQANVWCELDLTALAQRWVSTPASNYGLVLRGAGNVGVGYTLASMEAFNPAQRPIFEILTAP